MNVRKSYYRVRIEWGDCDAAAITFYPNYFAWFDAASWHLFETTGTTSRALMNEQRVFVPLVEAQAKFKRPGHLGEELVIESWVDEWREKMFRVRHVVRRGDDVLLEGTELRCWATPHPEDASRLQALPIPAQFRAALEGT